jgi:hypothetical protein
MSTINSKNVQVGTSGVANQNFTLYQPATPDGTVRLGVGNTGATTLDAVTVTNAGNVTVAGSLTAASISGVFPSGTAMMFVQTSAPTGWTKSTTHNNKALRVVSGSASSGGSVAFTTAFASQGVSGTVGSTTLTTSQIPGHTHIVTTYGFAGDLGFQPQQAGGDGSWYGFQDVPEGTHNESGPGGSTSAAYARSTGGGGSHNHSFTGTAIDLAVQYVDVIIATKD